MDRSLYYTSYFRIFVLFIVFRSHFILKDQFLSTVKFYIRTLWFFNRKLHYLGKAIRLHRKLNFFCNSSTPSSLIIYCDTASFIFKGARGVWEACWPAGWPEGGSVQPGLQHCPPLRGPARPPLCPASPPENTLRGAPIIIGDRWHAGGRRTVWVIAVWCSLRRSSCSAV